MCRGAQGRSIKLSVIICTYNRCASLGRTLESLLQLRIPGGLCWETIVVDNNCSDATKQVVHGFAERAPFPVVYLFEARQGSSEARNAGIERARGEIVSFLDDDVIVAPEWLSAVHEAFERFDATCVGGRVLVAAELPRPAWWKPLYDMVLGKCDLGERVLVDDVRNKDMISANLSVRRSAFQEALFSTEYSRRGKNLAGGEDTDFIKRLISKGARVVYSPQALVYHAPNQIRLTPHYIRRWYYRVGEFRALTEEQASSVVTWLGVPRWLYRSILQASLAAMKRRLTGGQKEIVKADSELSFLLGSFAGKWRRATKRWAAGQGPRATQLRQ